MRKNDTIPGLLVTIFGAVFFVVTWLEPKLTFIARTSDGVPGAGFFPYIMSGAVTLLGVALTMQGLRRKDRDPEPSTLTPSQENLKVLTWTVAGLIAFLAAWLYAGYFYLFAMLLCIYLNRLLKRSWRFTLLYSLGLCLLVYLVFTLGFSIHFEA